MVPSAQRTEPAIFGPDVTSGSSRSASRIVRRTPDVGPAGGPVPAALASRIQSAGPGRPLQPDLRRRMEPAFGSDLGRVRLHTESDLPAEIHAEAFTSGDHIHFAPGAFEAATPDGVRTLAHELAHVTQDDTTVRRIFKFDEALDNVVTTWKANALGAFSPGQDHKVVFSAAEFVAANLKRGYGGSPLPTEFALSAPWVRKAVREEAAATYANDMLPLRTRLLEVDKKLTKPQVGTIRSELQQLWADMVDALVDGFTASRSELDEAAQLTADDISAMKAAELKGGPKVLLKHRKEFAKKHAALTIYSEDEVLKLANAKNEKAKEKPPAWQTNAQSTLTADELVLFERERKMINLRLEQWETKSFTGLGCNKDTGTFGTSFGGSGTKFAHNPLPLAVYNALVVWWQTVKGQTYTTQSLTTDYSLKKKRINAAQFPTLSPIINYHIELAPT